MSELVALFVATCSGIPVLALLAAYPPTTSLLLLLPSLFADVLVGPPTPPDTPPLLPAGVFAVVVVSERRLPAPLRPYFYLLFLGSF